MAKKLLAMDLDGTAVKDDYSMSLSSIEAIKKAQDNGHVVAYVSGRRDVDMLTLGDEKWYVDYQILNNGGKIIRCKDKKLIINEVIDEKTSIDLINYALNNNLQLHICNGMIWQVTKMTDGTMDYARKVGVIPEVVDSLDKIDYRAIEGFMATSDLEPIAKYIDDNLDNLCYNHSEPGTIDIMKKGVSKWNGVKALADILNIDSKDTITVGNYYNDIEMLEKAGVGIAVANSVKEAKEAANYVTKQDNNHDAVKEIVDLMVKGEFDHE